MITKLIEIVYSFLWGDLIQIPLPGGSSVGISLLIILLIPMGIYFTVRTRFLPIRLFPDMVRALVGTKAKKDADGKSEKKEKKEKGSLSTFQTLIVSTATRVGMGNLVGVVAAISAGGAGAVFWMWVTALIDSLRQRSPSFIRKKIPCMVDTGVVRLIICIVIWSGGRKRKSVIP
mgnify:CR=1 FL=1